MEQVCRKCGKSKRTSPAGSITQWISACNCAHIEKAENAQEELEAICPVCKKRIGSGRAGSMTQWIFGASACACNKDSAKSNGRSERRVGSINRESGDTALISAQPAINVDAKLFPQNRYMPLAQLGSGAAGAVYLCTDMLLKKRVAVKTVRRLNPEQMVAFQREARAISALSHPDIVNVLDFGISEAGSPYMVLDFVPGTPLDRYIQANGSLPWDKALQIAIKLCQALEYAHKNGTYHRDIKPSNVLINEDAEQLKICLIDFGLAKVDSDSPEDNSIKRSGSIVPAGENLLSEGAYSRKAVGTPAYMSPDELEGREYDARSEIYSLGCLIFKCIAGRPPFISETPLETMAMHARTPAPRLSDMNVTKLPAGLDDLVAKCLEKNPERRFSTMEELRLAMEIVLAESGFSTQENIDRVVEAESPLGNGPLESSRTPVHKIMLLLICLVVIGVIALRFSTRRPESAESTKSAATIETLSGLKLKGNEIASSKKKELVRFKPVQRGGDLWLLADRKTNDLDLLELVGRRFALLRLVETRVRGEGLLCLKTTGVRMLDLESSPIQDKYLGYINHLADLEVLRLSGTPVSLAGLKKLNDLPKLHSLDCSNCKHFDSKCLAEVLKNFPRLTSLSVSSSGITGDDFPAIARLSYITDLDIGGIPATTKQYAVLTKLPLHSLIIDSSNIDDAGINLFAGMKSLGSLSVLGCPRLSRAGLDMLMNTHPKLAVISELSLKKYRLKNEELKQLDDFVN